MPRQWPKGEIPDDPVDRLGLAWERAKTISLPAGAREQVDAIMREWVTINDMAAALGVNLTKRDYREFMLRKMGAK